MEKSILGETEIILGGKKYFLKMNFLGLLEAENRSAGGVGSHALATRIASGISGIQDMAAIIYGGLIGKAGPLKEPPLSFEEVGQLIIEDGQVNHIPICKDLITFGMTGKWEEEWVKESNLKKKFNSPDLKDPDSIN